MQETGLFFSNWLTGMVQLEKERKKTGEKRGKGRMYPKNWGVCAEAVPLPPLAFLEFFARLALSMSGMSRGEDSTIGVNSAITVLHARTGHLQYNLPNFFPP